MQKKKILILGVGNILLCDEGFGVAAAEYLQQHYNWPENVTILDGGTQGFMLMSEIEACDFLIVLDIVLGQGQPGTIYFLQGEDLRKSLGFHDSTHQMDLLDTLTACELAGHRPEAIGFGLQPFDYQTMQVEISSQARALLPKFCLKVVNELNNRGLLGIIPS